jgi:hypothetical protein
MKYVYLALLALLLTACGPSGQQNGVDDPYIGGTEGLAVSFMQNAPPAEIYDGGQFPFTVAVVLQNLGEADIGPDSVLGVTGDNSFGLVQLTGINPTQFAGQLGVPLVMEKTFVDADISLTGARRTQDGSIIAGDTNIVQFDGFNYLGDNQGNTQVTLRANVCYDYRTRSNTQVCIKDNILENLQDDSICTLSGDKTAKNSGAPVHVVGLKQSPLGRDRIQVTFTIQNVGNGQIFKRARDQFNIDPYGAGPCDTSITNPNRNQVFVHVFLSDESMNGFIQCPLLGNSNQGYINLFQGNAVTMSCTLETNPQGNRIYTDTLRINLDYTYMQFVETPILIRDVSVGPADPRS